MPELELVFPVKEYEEAAQAYFEEHLLNGEKVLHGDSGLDEALSYDQWLIKINRDIKLEIHSIVFFAVRKADKKLIGTINIRYPYLGYVQHHGHIGNGIRPSERRRGYATEMLKLALDYCKKAGLNKVLLTCDKSNIGSAKTIMKCSGIFESEARQSNGDFLQRYWIEL